MNVLIQLFIYTFPVNFSPLSCSSLKCHLYRVITVSHCQGYFDYRRG